MTTIKELKDRIADDLALRALLEELQARLDDDPGHDLAHALRVALWTLRLGGEELDPREAIAAALLHDVVNLPKDSQDRASAGELSAELARELLAPLDFEPASIEAIAAAIRDHGFSRGATPDSALGRALQDADRLEALGALGFMRAIGCGVRMGAQFFDPEDPWAARRELDDKRFSIDHFFTKLLRLPETLHTAEGRAEARRRASFLHDSLAALARELGVDPPATG